MVHMESHKNWFNRVTNGESGRSAAMKAGVSTSTLNRQLSKGEITAEYVIALARAFGESPSMALVATGYLKLDEVSSVDELEAVRSLDDQSLIRELAFRIDADPTAWFSTFGELDERDQLKERRAKKSSNEGQSNVHSGDYDDDALIEQINSGAEPIAAQKRTDPLDENYT